MSLRELALPVMQELLERTDENIHLSVRNERGITIVEKLEIPTIGIGAGAGCDGQVQVWHDLLGLYEKAPRHAKRYGEIGDAIEAAIASYVAEVQAGVFPTDAQLEQA